MGGNELIFDAFFVYGLFDTCGEFVIEHLEKGAKAAIEKFCVEESVGAQELVGAMGLDGFCQDGIYVLV